jgi:hypothetical protein
MMFRVAMSCSVLALCGVAGAATWTVDDDGPADFDNIQAAINNSSDGDEIIVEPGTYTGTGGQVVDMLGKAITLRASGTAEETIIDGEGARSVVYCSSGEGAGAIIEGFTITGGSANNGGGIYCSSSNLTLSGCTISHNTAERGGGIYCWGSNLTIIDCLIDGNNSNINGGGTQFGFCEITMSNSTISNNQCLKYSGAGMHLIDTTGVIQNCDVLNNTTFHDGAGINVTGSSELILENCSISGNQSGGNGAGVHVTGTLQAINCSISDNHANGAGGGFAFWKAGGSIIDQCLIKNNVSKCCGAGGAINNYETELGLADSILCGNGENPLNGNFNDLGGNQILDVCFTCPGDATGDGLIDVNDLLYVLSVWATDDPTADFDEDGVVDVDDLLILLSHFGEVCP